MSRSVNINKPTYKSVPGKSNDRMVLEKSNHTNKIRVTAPNNLPAGYNFEASYTFPNGEEEISFEATVPEGGVSKGEVFLVPKPNTFPEPDQHQIKVPVGKWKDGLCDCFNAGICHPTVHCGFWCRPLLLAQVMERMRLTPLGFLVGSKQKMPQTTKIVAGIWCFCLFIQHVLNFIIQQDEGQQDKGYYYYGTSSPAILVTSMAISFVFVLWLVFISMNTRRTIRNTYSIPGSSCEDCLTSTFCGCCVVTQMARHTGEYEKHPGNCCSKTGLPEHAPMLIV